MQTSRGKIILGDCLEVMKTFEDNQFDLVLTDPPYGIGYADWDSMPDWGLLLPILERKLKRNGLCIIFSGWTNVIDLITSAAEHGLVIHEWIIYDRIKGRGANNYLTSTREDMVVFRKPNAKQYTFNKEYSNTPKKTGGLGAKNGQLNRSLSNVWTDISPLVPWGKEHNAHPTQKPLALMERLIRIYSNESDNVLDPFAGSGSTLVAAKNLNRKYTGIEINPDYVKIAQDRLKQEVLL